MGLKLLIAAFSCSLLVSMQAAQAENETAAAENAQKAGEAEPALRPALKEAEQSTQAVSTGDKQDRSIQAKDRSGSLRSPVGTPQSTATDMNQLASPHGILHKSSGHKRGLIARALGGAASDAGHAAVAVVGSLVMSQGIDLPPDSNSNPEWPSPNIYRKGLYTVEWADGSLAKISHLPDGSLQILGSGHRFILQPEGEGTYAMFGDYGTMATVTPRPGGGYTITKADGTVEQVLPRAGGGFVVSGKHGVLATILPGVDGSKHIRGSGYSSGLMTLDR